jgi:hypothetical protein
MRAVDDVVRRVDFRTDRAEEMANVAGCRIPHGIGQVDGGRPCLDHGLDHPAQERHIAPERVLRREFDVVHVPPSQFDRCDGLAEYLLLRLFQLVLQMDFAGRDNEVNARLVGLRKCRRRSGSETRAIPAGPPSRLTFRPESYLVHRAMRASSHLSRAAN